jgi:hypothetical protein
MVAEMNRLLDDHNYADVARILNENGFKTSDGLPNVADSWRCQRLQRGAAFQQTQFPIGDERVESVRMPLTIETNFSLKIPGLIHQENTLEELRVTTIRLKK